MAKNDTTKSASKYGVKTLAKDLGILETSVRVQLRNKGVKPGKDGAYGWNSDKDYKAVMAKLKKQPAAAPAKVKKKAA